MKIGEDRTDFPLSIGRGEAIQESFTGRYSILARSKSFQEQQQLRASLSF
jgi:hypothetical protein